MLIPDDYRATRNQFPSSCFSIQLQSPFRGDSQKFSNSSIQRFSRYAIGAITALIVRCHLRLCVSAPMETGWQHSRERSCETSNRQEVTAWSGSKPSVREPPVRLNIVRNPQGCC